jgi:hypothetical protein
VSQRREELLDRFPAALVERRLKPGGGGEAVRIYANWLSHLAVQKAKGPSPKSLALSPNWRRAARTHPAERLG